MPPYDRQKTLALAVTAAPLAHTIGGSGGFLDEIISFGLIGAIVAGLLFLSYLGKKNKKKRRQNSRPGAR
jgi:hypothetical protein